MNAVIYARYSSDNQREESIEGQIRECSAYAEKNGITILRSYIDRAFSAKTDNRPEFQEMIKDSGKKLFDMVIVWKLDRFARNRYDSARYKATLKKNGVKVVSATEAISSNAEGILLESLLEGLAEYYSVDLAEKVTRGMTENALKCKYNGGPILFGYYVDSQKHYQRDPLTAPFVLETYKKYDDGMTISQVQQWLNKQGVRSSAGQPLTYNNVQRILTNRRYIGEYRYKDTVIPGGIPTLVPMELYESVQKRLKANQKASARGKAKEPYLLTTKLFCGYCGAYLIGESGTSRTGETHRYYKCVTAKRHKSCKKKSVGKQWIEDTVVMETMKLVMDEAAIAAIAEMLMELQGAENTRLPLLEKQLHETELGINNLLNAIQMGIITTSTKERLDELEQQKENLKIEIANEQLAKPRLTTEFITLWLHKFQQLDVTNEKHRKLLIDTFVNSVYLFDDKLIITFNYRKNTREITKSEIIIVFPDLEKNGSAIKCVGSP